MLCFIKRGLHQFRYSPRLLLPLEEKHVTLAVVLTTVGRKHSLSNGAALSLYKQIPIAWDSKMPAFIGPHGAREKVGRGRGLFERSEFRSPRRREKRKAGKPDNERETFLGYFFAAGKKLRSIVILNEA